MAALQTVAMPALHRQAVAQPIQGKPAMTTLMQAGQMLPRHPAVVVVVVVAEEAVAHLRAQQRPQQPAQMALPRVPRRGLLRHRQRVAAVVPKQREAALHVRGAVTLTATPNPRRNLRTHVTRNRRIQSRPR